MRRPPAGAWLRALMGCSQAGVALVDAAGHVVECNDHWAGLCAVLDPDPVEHWQDLVQPEDRELVAAAAGAAAPGGGGGPRGRPPRGGRGGAAGAGRRAPAGRGRAPGAGTRWLSVSVAPVDGRDGASVVTVADIDAAKRDRLERTALHGIADVVARGEDTAAVFARVAAEVGVLLDADGAGVAQFDAAESARLLGRWAGDPELQGLGGDHLPLTGEGTTARVFATGRPSRVDYAELASGPGALPHPWRVSAAAPIRVEGRLWGALGVVGRRRGRRAAAAAGRLTRFAELVGIAIASAEARERLVRQARTDALTGLPHHGAFHESLSEEVARASRYGHPLSLAVIDLDHFKSVNDVHGHLVGDRTLVAVADILSDHARAIDVIARIGGEEFAWLMPQTAMPGARIAAERFRRAVGEASLGPVERLTVSVGVAAVDRTLPDADDVFRRADDALYRAKGSGRDRTMVSAAGPPAA